MTFPADERGFAKRLKARLPGRIFRLLTVSFNAVAMLLPFDTRYALAAMRIQRRVPYRLLNPDDVVIQIGAARDILAAGRSRAVHFARLVPRGQVVVIEADPQNRLALECLGLRNVTLVPLGAWKEAGRVSFLSSPNHPAANIVMGLKDVPGHYREMPVEVDTLDHIAEGLGLGRIDLLSITTNGAELEILDGSRAVLERCEYVSLASTGPDLVQRMEDLGFRYIARDDRGYCFRRADRSTEA